MLEELAKRLQDKALLDADYDVLAAALRGGSITASGVGSIAAGDVSNSILAPMVLQFDGGDPIAITEEILTRLTKALRRAESVLNNLPEVETTFTGRADEEASIVSALSAGEGGGALIFALKGVGGIGKTALAVKIAHRLTPLFPDAQLILDLRGTGEKPASPREAMEDVIRRFRPEGKLPDEDALVAEVYRDLLRQHKVLLLLDNAKDAAQVSPLLPPKPSAAIVTSRRVQSLAGVKEHRLDDLPLEEATGLLVKIFAGDRSLSQEERTALARACLCHPLSLRVAGLFLKGHRGQSVSGYVDRILTDRTRLKLEGNPDSDVMAVLGLSLEQLATEDSSLAENWRDLAVFPESFDAAAAAAVMQPQSAWNNFLSIWEPTGWFKKLLWRESRLTFPESCDRLQILETRGFVDAIGEDRYRLHDLMRDVARGGRSEDVAQGAARRHAFYFYNLLRDAEKRYLEGGEGIASGLSIYDREQANIVAAHTYAVTLGERSLIREFPIEGTNILAIRLHPNVQIKWLEAALSASRESGSRAYEEASLGNLGVAHASLGKYRDAIDYYNQQLVLVRAFRDRKEEAIGLGNLGIAYANLGRLDIAIDFHELSLSVARRAGYRRGEGVALGNLGNAYAKRGDTEKAVACHLENLRIAREIENRHSEASALGNLGNAYLNLNDYDVALDHYQQNLAISKAIGDRRGEGNALGNIGNVYAVLGKTNEAIEHYKQNLAIAREIADLLGEGNALLNMGLALKFTQPDETRRCWLGALAIYQKIENPNAQDVVKWLAELDKSGDGA